VLEFWLFIQHDKPAFISLKETDVKLATNILAASVFMTLISSSVVAQADPVAPLFSAAQKTEMEQVIRDYLIKNPTILVDMSNELQKQQAAAQQSSAKKAINENAAQVINGALSMAGNPKGDVTLVEFFDYQCIHCKKIKPIIAQLIQKNPNLRVVYKEFPIFGKTSETASKAALAASMQGKYAALQEALLKVEKKLDDQTIFDTAKSVGVDINRLKADMTNKAVTDALADNEQLAEKIHLMGTPAFIVMQTPGGQWKPNGVINFVPGAASETVLQDLIAQATPH
jgi:protein-disulfide isomerase